MAHERKSIEDLVLMRQGASVADLAEIFGMTPQEVNKRIVGKVLPTNATGKTVRYHLREAAPYLCNVVFDVEDYLRTMSPEKLPPKLQKAFWEAQNARQKHEIDKGDLWKTERVIEVLSEVFKAIRVSVMMLNDTVEEQVELTKDQRDIITKIGDGFLNDAHAALVDKFKDYKPPADEHGRPLGDEEEEEVFDDGFDE
jgi:hypothetical protein